MARPSVSSIAGSLQSNMLKWVYRIISCRTRKLVGADDEFGEKLIGEAVEVSSIELGVGASLEVGF